MNEKYHFFISYARIDGENFATQLYDDLRIRRINVWIDKYNLNHGEDVLKGIERALEKSIALILILTPAATLSQHVAAEWNKAHNLWIPIIPLLVSDCDIPPLINVLNWIDFREDYDAGIAALRRRINRIELDHLESLVNLKNQYERAQNAVPNVSNYQLKIDSLENAILRWKSFFADKKEVSVNLSLPTTNNSQDKGAPEMHKLVVGRKRELEQLNNYLTKMLTGHMQVCFIAGDAGTGKTALVREFAQKALTEHDDLLYVAGQCNDITGLSDSYLPFRQILGLLTGDESRKATVEVDVKDNRLKDILKTTGRALVEIAPELVGTLIPGAGIIAALGRMGAKEKGLLKGLEEHAQRVEQQKSETDTSQIVMQFTALLKVIAEQYPIIITLDDLQWADPATANLLFHLTRELRQSRIFFIILYRPVELRARISNNNDPFKDKLNKIFNEIRRDYANTIIDLNISTQQYGRDFIDELIDSFPNKLDRNFRDALYKHTNGHALFTVELLSEMQDRGDIILEDDYLILPKAVEWKSLPSKVEAVIEERIQRLTDELRETLTVTSVEGTDFTAQVLIKVRQLNEREIFRQLSELEKYHQLIHENGEQKVGRKIILQRYSFSHAYFQRYLYNSLSAGERRLLHGSIAQILEELYEGHTQDIALQLAQHYKQVGDIEKAVTYFIQVGEHILNLSEILQAQQIFEEALGLIGDDKDDYIEHYGDLLWWLGETTYHLGQWKDSQEHYDISIQVAKKISNPYKIARNLAGLALSLYKQYKISEALSIAQEALKFAYASGDKKIECKILRITGILYGQMDNIEERIKFYEDAYKIALQTNDVKQQMSCINSLGMVTGGVFGNYPKTKDYFEKALELAKKHRYLTSESIYLGNLSGVYRRLGNYKKAKECIEKYIAVRDKGGAVQTRLTLGRLIFYEGSIEKAIHIWDKDKKISDQYKRIGSQVDYRSCLIIGYLTSNKFDQALSLAEEQTELLERYQVKNEVYSELLLKATTLLNLSKNEQALYIFKEERLRAKNALPTKRWAYRYHYALAQAGVALLSPESEQQKEADIAVKLYKQAIKYCGWEGIVYDALLILRLLRKADRNDILKHIEDDLVEQREIACKNRPFTD